MPASHTVKSTVRSARGLRAHPLQPLQHALNMRLDICQRASYARWPSAVLFDGATRVRHCKLGLAREAKKHAQLALLADDHLPRLLPLALGRFQLLHRLLWAQVLFAIYGLAQGRTGPCLA